MTNPECFKHCPHIAVCGESLIRETQTGSASDLERITKNIEAIVRAAAGVALADCRGPRIEQRTIQKNGYWESKKRVVRNVYVCGKDDYSQDAAFYYQTDKMPGSGA